MLPYHGMLLFRHCLIYPYQALIFITTHLITVIACYVHYYSAIGICYRLSCLLIQSFCGGVFCAIVAGTVAACSFATITISAVIICHCILLFALQPLLWLWAVWKDNIIYSIIFYWFNLVPTYFPTVTPWPAPTKTTASILHAWSIMFTHTVRNNVYKLYILIFMWLWVLSCSTPLFSRLHRIPELFHCLVVPFSGTKCEPGLLLFEFAILPIH